MRELVISLFPHSFSLHCPKKGYAISGTSNLKNHEGIHEKEGGCRSLSGKTLLWLNLNLV